MPHHEEQQGGMGTRGGQQAGTAGQGGFPVDNVTYDLITILHTKLEGLAAYQKYMQDATGDQEFLQILQQCQQQDTQMAQQLQQHLAKHISKQGAGARH
jgi:hypothetical protein